jgi:hypothetical protein
MLTTLDHWKNRGIGHNVFFTLKQSLDIVINNNHSRGQDLYLLSIIFHFGPNFLNVWSLTFNLSMGNSPGASIPPPHPSPATHPSPAPHPWAISRAQIGTGLTRDPCRHSPTARSRGGHQHLQNFKILI